VTDTWDHSARLESYERVARVAATIEVNAARSAESLVKAG
jgi:hypothetical protein